MMTARQQAGLHERVVINHFFKTKDTVT